MFQHSWSQLNVSHKQFYFSYSYNWTRQFPAAQVRFSHMLQCLEHSSVQRRSCLCPLLLTSAFDYLTITICNNIHILQVLQWTEKFQDLGRRKHGFFQGRIDRWREPFPHSQCLPIWAQEAGLKGHKCYLSTIDPILFWRVFVSAATSGCWLWYLKELSGFP